MDVLKFLLLIFLMLISFALLIWWEAQIHLFYPNRKMKKITGYKLESYYLTEHGEHCIPEGDCINVWHYTAHADRPVILYFHGNTGNISQRKYVLQIAKRLNLNALLVDYKGYGNSSGSPSARDIGGDGIRAYNFLKKRYRACDIIVWGESLGGGPATRVASEKRCRALILFSTYASIEDVVKRMPGYSKRIMGVVGSLAKYITGNIPNKLWIKNVKCPLVVVHSQDDDYIDIENAKINFKAANSVSRKQFIKIRGKHAVPRVTSMQMKSLLNFIEVEYSHVNIHEICKILETAARDNDLLLENNMSKQI